METDTPILLFYANPGALIPPQAAAWLAGRLRNIETRYLGPGYHYVQEDHPHKIGLGLADWRRRLLKGAATK
jgi:haloalkane dehalogenase